MRKIDVGLVKDSVAKLCKQANFELSKDVIDSLESSYITETSKLGKDILNDLLINAKIAKDNHIPMCQDTGTAVIFAKVGQDIIFVGGSLEKAIQDGVKEGYESGYLRKSIVEDPLLRKNTNDNTPAIVHYEIVEGDKIELVVAPKGGGSENMSQIKMLTPSQGRQGVIDTVLEVVKEAGPNPCPPIVVGVGIGGNFESSAIMAKKALTRDIGLFNKESHIKELEKELLKKINNLNIGPQGFGGKTTALAVHIETGATHIASMPVAVNIGCHAYRHRSIIL